MRKEFFFLFLSDKKITKFHVTLRTALPIAKQSRSKLQQKKKRSKKKSCHSRNRVQR